MPDVSAPATSPAPSPSVPKPVARVFSIPRPAGRFSKPNTPATAPQKDAKTGPVTSSTPAAEATKPAVEAKTTPETPATKPEITNPAEEAPKPQLHKVKVNGQEREVTTEELLRAYGKDTTADERFRQASEKEKASQAETARNKAFAATLKDPAAFAAALQNDAQKYGIDPRALGEALLGPLLDAQLREAELAAMSPEQRKAHDLEQKLKEYENKEAQAKIQAEKDLKTQAETKRAAEVKSWREKFEPQMISALEKSGLPKTWELGAELVGLWKEARQNGQETTPDEIAAQMATRKRAEWAHVTKETGNLDYVTPEIRELIRKQAVEEHLKKHPMAASEPVTRGTVKKEKAPTGPPQKTKTFASLQRSIVMGHGKGSVSR